MRRDDIEMRLQPVQILRRHLRREGLIVDREPESHAHARMPAPRIERILDGLAHQRVRQILRLEELVMNRIDVDLSTIHLAEMPGRKGGHGPRGIVLNHPTLSEAKSQGSRCVDELYFAQMLN